ncbi:DNA primase, partial [Escherichia coli]|nr:DNA primase [Escherichia coli]
IDGWLKVLKSDKKALFRACRQARKASEYLLTRRTSQECAA